MRKLVLLAILLVAVIVLGGIFVLIFSVSSGGPSIWCVGSDPSHMHVKDQTRYSRTIFGGIDAMDIKIMNLTGYQIRIDSATRIDKRNDVLEIKGTLPKEVPAGETFELNLYKGDDQYSDIPRLKIGYFVYEIDRSSDVTISCSGSWE